jgi:hypothetical protein
MAPAPAVAARVCRSPLRRCPVSCTLAAGNRAPEVSAFSVSATTHPRMALWRARRWEGLRSAVRSERVDVVRALLADPLAALALISEELVDAVRDGHEIFVQFLLADGRADPAANDSAVLRCAVDRGHVEPVLAHQQLRIVKLLLADGRADPAANHSAALGVAARRGRTDFLLALLADGRADPTAIAPMKRCRDTMLIRATVRWHWRRSWVRARRGM